ncbi:hypothetical protein [Demequina sp.]|uniref:hypothetical protein n=1 Tax=Demequina sp. TaxID=2050685 RepID=UPI0025BFBD63|nr:hypothetical protein [Demequina sp.]
MRKLAWREPTAAERSVADDWIAAWNLATGDDATLPDDPQAASSCNCGTCPTFALRPVELRDPERQERPLLAEGGVHAADGSTLAGLIAFWDDSVLEIEVYPFADDVVQLEDATVVIDAPGAAH